MITIRTLVEGNDIDKNPMECLFMIASILRTWNQGESSTLEGDCASLNAARELYEKPVGTDEEKAAFVRFLLNEGLPTLVDMEIPEHVLRLLAMPEADEDTDEEIP